ncbi:MAG: OPT/YSL family transporter [Myxococcales bacterium]|nr:MAG: OPT/YSL family transporter [Myxococcales bacterium]
MPIAVGIYLPFGVTVPMLAGAFLSHVADHSKHSQHKGVLMSSGMIAGEALMGIFLAGLAALSIGRVAMFAEGSLALTTTTLVLSVGGLFWMWRWLRHAN